ncbi:hypothetical protein A2791_03260 [Candidatus Saccharibacteria bacterium RIFCSPHIGHO2_01_FULL_46_30]|nr:MAG: hypothetical protein A2791_03260 [Candidatus Saccharibacteria bacterium RIFCSPHIGHO2_01_FULL_46_30]
MKEVLGDYEAFVAEANKLIDQSGIARKEIIMCDTLCYRVETNERYDELKKLLASHALSSHEEEVNQRMITVYSLREPLNVPGWQRPVPYIEVPQPKPGSPYPEGFDHAQFVTLRGLGEFRAVHTSLPFDEKGLSHTYNQLVKLSGKDVAIKFHDKHMGSVIELERATSGQ